MPESRFLKKHHRREASAFRSMHRCCLEPQHKDFWRYGGASPPITICERWLHQWQNFIQDMGEAPSEEHWLGRLDVTKGYSPVNTCWTLPTPQKRRRAYCKKIQLHGELLTIAEAARAFHLMDGTLRYRLKVGMSLDLALTATPRRTGRPQSSKPPTNQEQQHDHTSTT